MTYDEECVFEGPLWVIFNGFAKGLPLVPLWLRDGKKISTTHEYTSIVSSRVYSKDDIEGKTLSRA